MKKILTTITYKGNKNEMQINKKLTKYYKN